MHNKHEQEIQLLKTKAAPHTKKHTTNTPRALLNPKNPETLNPKPEESRWPCRAQAEFGDLPRRGAPDGLENFEDLGLPLSATQGLEVSA